MTISQFAAGHIANTNDLLVQSVPVLGGTLYISIARPEGPSGGISDPGLTLVSSSAQPTRNPLISDAKTDAGIALTGTAANGAMGASRNAGNSLYLVGETTSGNAKTDKVFWCSDLPDSYLPGNNIPLMVNASIGGTGLMPQQRIGLELTMLVTSSSGANPGQINSVQYAA